MEETEDLKRTAGPLITARSTGIRITVEKHVWDKINGWCNAATSEVSGMFCVRKDKHGFHAYDVFLPEQECSSGFTVFRDESYSRMKNYVYTKYGVDAMMELCCGWWHTHYNFSPFWSGTDDRTAQKNMFDSEGGWSVSIVVNQKNAPRGDSARFCPISGAHYQARTDILNPVKVTIDNLPVEVVPNSKYHRHKTPSDYKRDIKRWVRPLVHRKLKPTFQVVPKTVHSTAFTNFNGKVVPSVVANAILAGYLDDDCPFCKDFSCMACEEMIQIVTRFS